MNQLSEDQLQRLREKATESLYVFAKGILGFDWFVPHIHGPLCKLLEDYENNRRLVICLPRGWLKTTLCSQVYPLWRAIRNPEIHTLLVQNTFQNAVNKIRMIKSIVEGNQLFRALFPELLPNSRCVWKNDSLQLAPAAGDDTGTFDAAGAGTQITGRHYNLIIEDDTVAPDLSDLGETNVAPTKDDIVQAIGWHRLSPPLLVNQSEDQILIVGTRWFEKDLISWVCDNEPYYKKYFRSCRENEAGQPDESGHITYPERFDEAVLAELKAALGPYMFSCLYYNKPIRSDDMAFLPEWIRHYDTAPGNLMVYTTVDPGGDPAESKGTVDWSVVMTCGKDLDTGYIYVLEYTREKMNPGELINAIFDHYRRHKPVTVGIESVQYQKALHYWVKERMRADGTYFRVEPIIDTRRSKEVRIRGLIPVFSNGAIFLRSHMQELESELLVFPLGAHDDLPDALAMQLEMWQRTRSKREELRDMSGPDPLSVDAAIKEIAERNEPKGPILDVMKPRSRYLFDVSLN